MGKASALSATPAGFTNSMWCLEILDFHKRQDSTPDVIWIFDRGRMDNRACSTS
jgi:hypothetical protein